MLRVLTAIAFASFGSVKGFVSSPSFVPTRYTVSGRAFQRGLGQRSWLQLSSQDTTILSEHTTTTKDASEQNSNTAWAKYAMLISSFSDGILTNANAQSFLKHSLACLLLEERVRTAEARVRESVLASPCNGPDIDAFNSLERYDEQLHQSTTVDSSLYNDAEANRLLKSFAEEATTTTTIRLLYIPTAAYALNPNSSNTPGKQRQRARADGKKRRNQVVQHLQDLLGPHLPNFKVLAITLDLDDGSLKQPTGSDEAADFPTNGVESLTTWEPQVVYIEGGNTFWLQHCLEKGDWATPLRKACTGPDATSLYIGKSAGAIVAGATVETATWKGWDDPSVVPNQETYDDWKGHPGQQMAGPARSFFPHMNDDWEPLAEAKRTELEDVACLREWDAFCVDGNAKEVIILSGEEEGSSQRERNRVELQTVVS